MHKLILGKRNHSAHTRILKAAHALSEQFEIPADAVAALKVQEKDTEVRAMKEREAVANLLEAVAESLGIDLNPEPEAVTEVTDPAADPNLNGTDPEAGDAGDGGTPQGEGVPEGTDGDASDLSDEDAAAQRDAGDGLPAPDVSAAG